MNKLIKTATYSIFINATSIAIKKSLTKKYTYVFVLVDENTKKHCYQLFLKKYPFIASHQIIQIKSGEECKNLQTCELIWKKLLNYHADRNSLIINLGGGVLSDIGGFVASTYKRGIDYINIPTTLLAQVDASIGSKTGIDFENIKNCIGTFYTPHAVIIDTDFLKTLPKRQIASGFAEVVKHALISNKNFWKKIKTIDSLFNIDFEKIIYSSILVKNKIVAEDEMEKSIRKKLNFGHTIGHALESFSLKKDTNKRLTHGEAIAIGMIIENYISYHLKKLAWEPLKEINLFISHHFKKYSIHQNHFPEIIELLLHDKKNKSQKINFTLLEQIGVVDVDNYVDKYVILEALNQYAEH